MAPKILYVDDDRSNLVVFKAAFGTAYEVVTAESAAEALAILRSQRDVALLITDQRMPKMLGTELCEAVRREFPYIIRFLITAYSDLAAAVDAINRGQVHRYLRKPWQPDELKIQIDEGIELRTLRASTRDLEARMREVERIYTLGVVAASVVHELRNPMSAVLGLLDLLSRHVQYGNDEVIHLVDEAKAASLQIVEILRGVELSSRHHVATGKANLSEIVALTLRIVRSDLIQRAITEVNVEPQLIVPAAPTPMGQVVLNLLVNSIQALRDSDPAVARIRVVGRAIENRARLTISDTGPGVSAELRAKIFEPFFTTKAEGGTGLGLAISKQIVTDAGGTLTVTDTPGGGATFVVDLPLA